jgi:hypothetical protein
MKFILRLVWTVPLMAVAAFCLFGFVATFEPMPRLQQWVWRAVYAAAGSTSLLTICWIWLRSKKHHVTQP